MNQKIEVIDLCFQGNTHTVACFLVHTSDGPLLIETGPHSTYSGSQKALKEKGIAVEDIKHVLITHIHLDHAGAAWAWAQNGATIYLHHSGKQHMIDPSKLYASAQRIYGDEMHRLWGDLKPISSQKLVTVGHLEELTFGDTTIKALHTPGHAIHHIAWQMEDTLFAGDSVGVKIDGGPVVPPCPPPDIDLGHWNESLDMIDKLDIQTLYLTHFGPVTEVSAHLQALKLQLDDWAGWVKERLSMGQQADEMIPDFKEYVANQLKSYGVDTAGIEKYESANPPWMSVYGLIRYWKKNVD
ncbi:MAG: MBL fold metallo-hydrolase [Bacteroidetes bacterium]|nr:MBL fold metallo-hydrolase [Bacteroidota bacterium]